MAKKRIQNRIGDIYCVTLEDGARIYLQYVAIDTEQLYSLPLEKGGGKRSEVLKTWVIWMI